MEKAFKILETIQRVDAPIFLYSKILSAVKNRQREIVTLKWGWAAAIFLMIVFALNFTAIQASKKVSEPNLLEVFSLQSHNIIYYE